MVMLMLAGGNTAQVSQRLPTDERCPGRRPPRPCLCHLLSGLAPVVLCKSRDRAMGPLSPPYSMKRTPEGMARRVRGQSRQVQPARPESVTTGTAERGATCGNLTGMGSPM